MYKILYTQNKYKKNYIQLGYSFSNNKTLNPYNINFDFESSKYFNKLHLKIYYNYDLINNKRLSSRFYLGNIFSEIDSYNIQMSAWNGNMDYAFNERSFSREDDGNLSRQMFIREGGLKHYTDIRSNNILTSLSVDYNLHRLMNLYVEAGYGGELAFGSGCIFNLGKMKIYLPLITEKGLFNGGGFHEGIRIQIQREININTLF